MNLYDEAIDQIDLAPYRHEWCCVCGRKYREKHHVIPRSHGGKDKHIIHLCSACHREAHSYTILFIAYEGHLMAYQAFRPISIDEAVLNMSGWYSLFEIEKKYRALWHENL